MNPGIILRRPRLSMLLLLSVVLLGWIWQERVALWAFPDIISAYTAKEYCSCRYVENNPADYCQGYVTQYVPVSSFLDDAPNKRVTVSGMGRSHIAAWLGARQGCRLNP
ncbi:amidase [Pseudomonas helvetica]|uniref:amidase n=1 Tax=Pseudomonas helvetica TaxID=3136738 RepID=UPI00326352C4